MAALRGASRLQVGSATWISEERTSALQIADAEAEEFTFSARNDLDWLNEHMAQIFSENQLYVGGKLLVCKTDSSLIGTSQIYSKRLGSFVERHHGQRENAVFRKDEQ